MGEKRCSSTSPSCRVSRRCFQASEIGLSLVSSGRVPNWKAIGPELGIVDPVLPFLQPPDAAGHDDRHVVQAELAHLLAQLQHAGIGVLRLGRVLAVGQAVMAAGQPGVLVDHAAQQFARLAVAALPQRDEGARRRR